MVGLTQKEWEEKLRKIAAGLKTPAKLTLMGAAPNILGGQPARTSIDLDVWKPTSQFDRDDLQAATEKAGLLFDPKSEADPHKPYIQIVEPGICQLGKFRPVEMETRGKLKVERPPAENLVAAKLTRAQNKDLEDIAWLMANHQPDRGTIKQIIKSFPRQQRETATENLVFLEIIAPEKKTRAKTHAKQAPDTGPALP